ncbi:P-loop NTPase fold protein [Pseudomonas sp. NA-150]|uniref:P-loop NTPase fold protein n=1 Tax=Pseudomonas sp. NA-150 TaxID=3367525 RepID=UPI0037C576B0
MATHYTNEAVRFLDYYLDDAADAEFAVMLNAPWGAGKTHFIENYLKGRSDRIDQVQKPCYLYASLYGVTSTSAINDQFFAQIHPQLSSKASRVIGSVAAHWVDKISGTKNSDQLVRDMLLKLEGKVLVIDDLERCSMKIADVLGFINTFVEHEGLKVIILVNEADIPSDQRAVYDRQKEKLVGKTLEVKSDPEEVLLKLSERFSLEPVKQTVAREKSSLLDTFCASGKLNFRNLRAILADYERLVEAVDVRLRDKPDALKQLLLYMVATGSEFRSGALSGEAFKSLPSTHIARVSLYAGTTTKTPSEQMFSELSNRYPEVNWADPIVSPKHLAELYSAGVINVEEINKGLGEHPAVVGHANIPAWRLLWNWNQLPKTEYIKAKKELQAQLADHKLIHPGLILHVAGIAISLREYGDQILGEGVEPEAYFNEYVATLVEQNALTSNRGPFGFDSMAALGLGYSSANSPEFKAIYEIVKQAADGVERRQMKTVACSYVARLESNPDSYSSLYEFGVQEKKYGNAPFLHHIDVADFSRLLIVDSCSNDHLFASLIKRFEHNYQRGSPLQDEYDWLGEMKSHLLVMANADIAPFKEVLRLRVKHYFGKIEEGIGRPAATE